MEGGLKASHGQLAQIPRKPIVGHEAAALTPAQGKQLQVFKLPFRHAGVLRAPGFLQGLTQAAQKIRVCHRLAVAGEEPAHEQEVEDCVSGSQYHSRSLHPKQKQHNGRHIHRHMGKAQPPGAALLLF